MKELVSYRPITEVPGVNLLTVRHSTRLWRVYHETYTVCTVTSETNGCSQWVYRGESHESPRMSLMMMEPGEAHAMKKVKGWGSFDVLTMAPSVVQEISDSLGLGQRPHWTIANMLHPQLHGFFSRLYQAVARGACKLEVESRFIRCVSTLIKHCAEGGSKRPPASPSLQRFVRAGEFIRENCLRNITLQELASLSGLSRYHFLRGFCRIFGFPPHAYQVHMRINRASKLLALGMPAARLDVGFSDQSHLIRCFKKVMGVTPGQYADMVRRPFSGVSA